MSTTIKTRMPPSPTGLLHIGNVRTLLFNYLFAMHKGGTCVLRIEDTDKERSKREYEDNILEALSWLGISYEGPYRQSERNDLYKPYLDALLASDKAYLSKEESKMNPGEMVEVVRLRNTNTVLTFTDEVRGDISVDTTDLGDMVIARDMDSPLYHFTVVVDDYLMGVTHVIRGDDHIANTPRQILIQEALGFPRPVYAHLSLILAADKTKLSKRHGAVAVTDYRDMGYLKEAIINYLALLGWSPKSDEEFFTIDELIARFDISGLQKGAGVFDVEKLNWFNAHYIQKRTKKENLRDIALHASEALYAVLEKSDAAYTDALERITRIPQIKELEQAGEFSFYTNDPAYESDILRMKGKIEREVARTHLSEVRTMLESLDREAFVKETIKSTVWDYATNVGRGNVLWPMRVALSGKEQSPDPFTITEAIGKDAALKRIDHAISLLS